MSSESVTLIGLPDDVLLSVLQLLRVEDLLACRLVCKRLEDLVQSRDVWRHRTLSGYEPSAGAVLRLAPCLKRATVGERTLRPLLTTSCAVQHLTLSVDQKLGFGAAEFAQVVRRQEALGRLRHVDLVLWSQLTSADELMTTLAASSSLESLELHGENVPSTFGPVPLGPPGSSLKRFRCILTKDSQSFVDAVLAGHASTLQFVDLCGDMVYRISEETTSSRLPASMPKLQELRSEWFPGLEAVASYHSLSDLTLYVCWIEPHTVDGAAQLLRRATQLRSVSVHLFSAYEDPEDSVELIEALAVPGRSLAELFVLGPALVVVPPLCRALPALRQLTALRLDDPFEDEMDEVLDDLLEAIASAPALRLLELRSDHEDDDCAHAWMHEDRVQAFLKANPTLHIVRDLTDYPDCEVCEDCEDCALGCPKHRRKPVCAEDLGLFAHDEDKCPSPEYHADSTSQKSVLWVQIQ